MIVVVKSYIRNKKIVDLPAQTAELLEAMGFHVKHWHNAMLTKTWEEDTLFEGTVKKEKSRKSFFRRLCEAKGAPRIDSEIVLCAEK